jgi:hypothetical protein
VVLVRVTHQAMVKMATSTADTQGESASYLTPGCWPPCVVLPVWASPKDRSQHTKVTNDPIKRVREPSVVVHTCNPSTQRLRQHSETLSQNIKEREKRKVGPRIGGSVFFIILQKICDHIY